MSKYLKIKIKSLASEAKHIRHEERISLNSARIYKINSERETEESERDVAHSKAKYELFWGLHRYRTHTVRKEARDSQIAYAFLRGREYSDLEDRSLIRSSPNWNNVERMVFEFSDENSVEPHLLKQRWEQWVQIARGIQDEPKASA